MRRGRTSFIPLPYRFQQLIKIIPVAVFDQVILRSLVSLSIVPMITVQDIVNEDDCLHIISFPRSFDEILRAFAGSGKIFSSPLIIRLCCSGFALFSDCLRLGGMICRFLRQDFYLARDWGIIGSILGGSRSGRWVSETLRTFWNVLSPGLCPRIGFIIEESFHFTTSLYLKIIFDPPSSRPHRIQNSPSGIWNILPLNRALSADVVLCDRR